ncbi:hypothetical protein GCM10010129_83830 [Streptomyces fumigatiscleroticus]|nr:hypothetical protein GCM10010129_83830 [Streptomyces fumigatiscleroticus]
MTGIKLKISWARTGSDLGNKAEHELGTKAEHKLGAKAEYQLTRNGDQWCPAKTEDLLWKFLNWLDGG